MSELGFDMIPGCLITCAVGLILELGVIFLIDSYKPEPHCIKCDRVIHKERYCPDCGTPTDSVIMHNYWERKD